MPAAVFQHKQIGDLVIDNGIDNAEWGYNMNTAVFPTYGGEVVQILSVYIDDLALSGTCATYAQIEAIYSYFSEYLQIATQGKSPTPNNESASNGPSFNLYPVYFSYPHRDWSFKIYPKQVPGFRLGREIVTPTWQLNAFVIDDSPDLDLIKDGLKSLSAHKLVDGSTFALNGEISPSQGNPDTDPFQTYTQGISQQQQAIQKYADYYNSLLPAYQQGDFSALTAGIGAYPSFGQTSSKVPAGTTNIPGAPHKTSRHTNHTVALNKAKARR